jgi:hypothetical protein
MRLKLSREEKLAIYLKQFIAAHEEIKNQRKFVEEAERLNPKGSDAPKPLDAPTLSRIINQRARATDKTYEQIARVVSGDPNATVESLWERVNTYDFPDVGDSSLLSLASGYTAWSGLLLAAMGKKDETGSKSLLSGVRFAFADQISRDEEETPNREPNWIEDLTDLNAVRQSTEDLTTVYIAENLVELFKAGSIDGFFMLRDTFAKTPFAQAPNDPDTPVQVCRVASGFGVHAYIIGTPEQLAAPAAPLPGIEDSEVRAALAQTEWFRSSLPLPADEWPDAYEVVRQTEWLKRVFNKNYARIYQMSNHTVDAHLEEFMDQTAISSSFSQGNKVLTLRLGGEPMQAQLAEIKQKLLEAQTGRPTVVALVGFEPILNRYYHRLLDELGDALPLKYAFVNLSKLININSTYCLYCHPNVLRNSLKLVKINEFLSLINLEFAFTPAGRSTMAELLFPDKPLGRDETTQERMKRVFADLKIKNNMLPFFQVISRILLDAG